MLKKGVYQAEGQKQFPHVRHPFPPFIPGQLLILNRLAPNLFFLSGMLVLVKTVPSASLAVGPAAVCDLLVLHRLLHLEKAHALASVHLAPFWFAHRPRSLANLLCNSHLQL